MNPQYFFCVNQEEGVREVIYCLMLGCAHREKFPSSVRQFSLGLHYHSPRAYEFVRTVFNNNLPAPSTLRAWYGNSDMDFRPGISEKALELLKTKIAKVLVL